MKPAVTVEQIFVHCDSCGHDIDSEPAEWLLKPCPECGAPDIITEGDIAVFNNLVRTVFALQLALPMARDDAPMQTVTIKKQGGDYEVI